MKASRWLTSESRLDRDAGPGWRWTVRPGGTPGRVCQGQCRERRGGAGIGSAPGPGLNDCVPLRHFVSATALRDQVFISISQAGHCSAEKLEGWGLWEESERPLEV